ncbi:hypothetical protein TNCV_2983341, partial [Trichonephila clavipes]
CVPGRGSRVVKVSDRGWLCHEFEPSTTRASKRGGDAMVLSILENARCRTHHKCSKPPVSMWALVLAEIAGKRGTSNIRFGADGSAFQKQTGAISLASKNRVASRINKRAVRQTLENASLLFEQ